MPDKAPPKKPKKFMPMLDMLNTEAAVNTLSPKTYADYVGIFSRKAFENGEIDVDEYLKIVKPLFGETGEMVTEKIDNYRTKFLDGGDTEYNAMVTGKYIELGGKEGTGMDIDTFAKEYFPKFAHGGRAQFGTGTHLDDDGSLPIKQKTKTGPIKGGKTPQIPTEEFEKYKKYKKNILVKAADGGRIQFKSGSQDPDTGLSERVKELMDDGYEFGQAVKQAMEETRENNGDGTMPKSEKWMREYFFDGKGGYDERMSYKEFALGPGQELYKKFGND